MSTNRVTLAEAALRLRQTYDKVRGMVLRGVLPGGRDELGRFYVDVRALRRLERKAARERADRHGR